MRKMTGKVLVITLMTLGAALHAECLLDCNSKECYTPAYYEVAGDCGLYISGDFLYWYAREEGLSYALKTETIVQTTRPGEDPTWNLSPVKYKYFDPDWDPGFRVGFGAKTSCDGWDYSFGWTYYCNKTKTFEEVPDFNAILPIVGELALINPWSSSTVNAAAYFSSIAGKWGFRLNSIDFELGRRYWLSPCFTLRPFAGARGAWTKTTLRLTSTHNNAVNQIDVPGEISSFLYKDSFRNQFWGAGPLVGLQPTWHFCDCLSLFGSADFAMLWGKFKTRKQENYQINSISPTTGALIEDTNYQACPRSNFFSMQPILDIGVGLRWNAGFCNSCYLFSIDLGWEHHIWWNQITRYQPTGTQQIPLFVNNNTLIQAQTGYTENVHDLVFGGFVIHARFDF